jgi:hypothetical protein
MAGSAARRYIRRGMIMSQENDKEIRELIGKVTQLKAQYEALSPEARELMDTLMEANAPYFEFLDEIKKRLVDGSMSAEEAGRWLDGSEKEIVTDLRRRRCDSGPV